MASVVVEAEGKLNHGNTQDTGNIRKTQDEKHIVYPVLPVVLSFKNNATTGHTGHTGHTGSTGKSLFKRATI
jgi:hypothetical protein